MSMSKPAALYLLHSAKCIEFARASTDSESKLALFEMARSWRVLADQADKNSETTVPVYETPDPSYHPTQQQQQQPQPDDTDKKD